MCVQYFWLHFRWACVSGKLVVWFFFVMMFVMCFSTWRKSSIICKIDVTLRSLRKMFAKFAPQLVSSHLLSHGLFFVSYFTQRKPSGLFYITGKFRFFRTLSKTLESFSPLENLISEVLCTQFIINQSV